MPDVYGNQAWDASGVKVWDSSIASGGMSLGFYTIPISGVISFPTIVGPRTGFALPGSAAFLWPIECTTDTTLGYLRFVFSTYQAGYVVALFMR